MYRQLEQRLSQVPKMVPARFIQSIQVVNVVLSGGQIHDSDKALDLLDGVDLANRAYSCDKIRSYLVLHGAIVCIPDKVNFKVKLDFDAELYKQRNLEMKS